MCDVLFVTPSKKRTSQEECEGSILLATILRKEGIDADIYRFYEADMTKGFNSFLKETVENICRRNPHIVSFYCRCDCFLADIRIAEELKKINKDLKIVFGGPQATATCRETLEELPFVDYCCSGEGETTVVPFFGSLLKGEDVTFIEGLTYRTASGEIISNPAPELIKDLDKLPYIDYDLIPEEVMNNTRESNNVFSIDGGRGCPFNCAYCSTSLFWERKFRLKSSQRIVDEMKRIYSLYGINRFAFHHDLFTANKKNVLEFCRLLKESGLDLKWGCSSRIDTIDEEMVQAMKEAGLFGMFLGIESGSERMQKLMHKNLKVQDILDVSKLLCKHNVNVNASFMYGFPEETEEDIEQTLQLVLSLINMGVKEIGFHLCAMFPGTEYYNTYKDELVFAVAFSDQTGDFGIEENYDFICKHKSLFPFYYEYRSDLRTKFAYLARYALSCVKLYKNLVQIDPDKFENTKIIDLYLNSALEDIEFSATNNGKAMSRLIDNASEFYLPKFYAGEDLERIRGILEFIKDNNVILSDRDSLIEVKDYSVNVKDYLDGKKFGDIEICPTMVYFKKTGKTMSYIVRKR